MLKNTSNGDCLNYNSMCPDRYKLGVLKSLLYKSYAVSSTWVEFDNDVNRIKQLLTNNNFPMHLIDKTIKDFVNLKVDSVKALIAYRRASLSLSSFVTVKVFCPKLE
jgi:hypothetical protein